MPKRSGKNDAKTYKNIQKWTPNTRSVLSGKWCPERLQETSGGKKSHRFGAILVEHGAPKADLGTNAAPKMVPKIEKIACEKHLKIDGDKVLNIIVKWFRNCGQMYGNVNKFI